MVVLLSGNATIYKIVEGTSGRFIDFKNYYANTSGVTDLKNNYESDADDAYNYDV